MFHCRHVQSDRQVLCRLMASPDSACVSFTLSFYVLSSGKEMSELASTCISLLVRYQGYLQLQMTATARQQHPEVKMVHCGSG